MAQRMRPTPRAGGYIESRTGAESVERWLHTSRSCIVSQQAQPSGGDVRHYWKPTIAGLAATLLQFAAPLAAQTARPDTSRYVTTQGTDTLAIEQYVRTGNTITGAWIQHQAGLYVHDYALVLGADGWPAQYVMTLYTTRPHTFLLSVTYGPDSATRIMVRDSIAVTERVVAQKAYPVGALSILGVALALERARRAGVDSTTLALDAAEVRGPTAPLPVKFFGDDSARISGSGVARLDRDGRLLELRQGPRDTQRVATLPVAKLVAGFGSADSAARAARVAIVLPPAALQRFVGEYALTPTVALKVTLDGDRLMLQAGQQPATQIIAASATTFFFETVLGTTLEFETDATGRVTALDVVQSGRRQRLAKTK